MILTRWTENNLLSAAEGKAEDRSKSKGFGCTPDHRQAVYHHVSQLQCQCTEALLPRGLMIGFMLWFADA